MRENETGGTTSRRGVDPAIQSFGTWAVDLHVSELSLTRQEARGEGQTGR